MTSPSVGAVSIRRGSDPVASRMASPSSRSTTSPPAPPFPSGRRTSTVCGPTIRPRPSTTFTPSARTFLLMSSDWARARSRTRRMIVGRSTSYRGTSSPAIPSKCTPRLGAVSSVLNAWAEVSSVLDGTQSHSTQAPPSPSSLTMVTSAPRSAATRAAS